MIQTYKGQPTTIKLQPVICSEDNITYYILSVNNTPVDMFINEHTAQKAFNKLIAQL